MTASKNGNGKRALKHYRPQKMNANKHTPFGLSKLRESIGADGIIGAITVARDGESFDGSARLETLAEAMPSVKIVEVETDGNTLIVNKRKDIPNANSPRAKRLGVAANVIAKLDYNPDGEILAALAAEDKMIADYVKAERDSLRAVQEYAAGNGADADPQIDRAEELRVKWGVERGQLWRIGEHRLLCGDSTVREDVARVMGGERAGAVVTDPPYNVGKDFDNDSMSAKQFHDFCLGFIENCPCAGVFISFGSPNTFPALLDAGRECGWRFGRMLWLFKPGTAFGVVPWHGWARRSECILVFEKNPDWPDWVDYAADMYEHKKGQGATEETLQDKDCALHPTLKPLWVVRDLVSHTTGTIYEPFSGSGTTLVACQNLNRRGRGIEISPAYIAVTLQRMQDAFPDIEIKRL